MMSGVSRHDVSPHFSCVLACVAFCDNDDSFFFVLSATHRTHTTISIYLLQSRRTGWRHTSHSIEDRVYYRYAPLDYAIKAPPNTAFIVNNDFPDLSWNTSIAFCKCNFREEKVDEEVVYLRSKMHFFSSKNLTESNWSCLPSHLNALLYGASLKASCSLTTLGNFELLSKMCRFGNYSGSSMWMLRD